MRITCQGVLVLAMLGIAPIANAETVFVKYRGVLSLEPFECEWVNRSSLVKRLCYDRRERYAVVNLNGTYYHYCGVPEPVIVSWKAASSMGSYYNRNIRGDYDCRVNHVPDYR